jgi:ubiquinone/menaquinone biosynthesis C-methylase UbiE
MGKIDYPAKYKYYNQLTGFEKFILRTCCYTNKPTAPAAALETTTDDHADMDAIKKRAHRIYEAFLGDGFFKLIQGKKVLDFGCGHGDFVLGLAMSENCTIDGIDIWKRFQKAQKYIDTYGIKNAGFFHGNSKDLLPDNSYDVIISYDSFEHFEYPEHILSEMIRLTRKGGKIIIKFGPIWKSPWGRHMGGTFRKDRPWLHLWVSEKSMMRIHSTLNNRDKMYDAYRDLDGGLNKMTVSRAIKILKTSNQLSIDKVKLSPVMGVSLFEYLPVLKEYLCDSVYFECTKL